MKTSRSFRKKLLSASVASVLGLSASGPLNADTFEFSFSGAFTMLTSGGAPVPNSDTVYKSCINDPYFWCGNRTPITGTMTYDTAAGTGTVTINGFFFFGSTTTPPSYIALARDTSILNIGNGTCTNNTFPPSGCQPGNLLLGNLLFDWHGTVGIPVSIVWDARGLLEALPTAVPGTEIFDVGALPASDGINFNPGGTPVYYTLAGTVGATGAPMATTTWNATPLCNDPVPPNANVCLNVNPSGATPLIADTIGGSPMIDGPFQGFNANFDFIDITVTKKNGVSAAPFLQTKAPAASATNVNVGATVTLSFTNSMQATTVATAFSLTGPGGTISHGSGGTLSPSSGNATNFTFTPNASLSYTSTYTATVGTGALDVAAQPLSGAPIVWSFTTAAPPVEGTACTPVAQAPVGGNFTMLTGGGVPFGGTNDITSTISTIDLNNLNTSVSGTNFNMTMASAKPQPFFGYVWTAHHIRVFGPGTWTFDTTCTVAQIEAGTSTCNNALGAGQTQRFLTMTVGEGQLGAHMLFDWNTTQNIDVVNVWNQNSTWNSAPAGDKNDLWTGDLWAGPAGLNVNPNTTWQYVSTDNDGDGNVGVPMVDGPFISFSANFNLGAANSCQGEAPIPIEVGTVSSSSATGCSISTKPSSITVFERSDWLFVGGFLAWLGALRFRTRRSAKA